MICRFSDFLHGGARGHQQTTIQNSSSSRERKVPVVTDPPKVKMLILINHKIAQNRNLSSIVFGVMARKGAPVHLSEGQ